jgi:hypothetical protein
MKNFSHFQNLALWAQMPGDDFKKKWAQLLFKHEWLYNLWNFCIAQPICFVACIFAGHYIMDDHCGKPEHRYCLICKKITPYQPVEQ